MALKKRTTQRSKVGKKLYAERSKTGRFKDIQTYERAHGQDIPRVSKDETAKRTKAGMPARKKAAAKK
jgi:hypothetical protein